MALPMAFHLAPRRRAPMDPACPIPAEPPTVLVRTVNWSFHMPSVAKKAKERSSNSANAIACARYAKQAEWMPS
jgi:hypothetical protein